MLILIDPAFEWDPVKRNQNIQRHKLDLLEACDLFDGRSVISYPSPRDGEQRFVTVGRIGGRFHAAVWTERDGNIRLISFRRARDGEERQHRASFG